MPKTKKNSWITLALILIILFTASLYYYQYAKNKENQQRINDTFTVEISRISGVLDSNLNGNNGAYLQLVEHVSKVAALSPYTSYSYKRPSISDDFSEMINLFRNLSVKLRSINKQDELRQLFVQLSKEPTIEETYSEIFNILLSQ